MKLLLLGGGGREHALGWKLAQSPGVSSVVSAPGNPGLAEYGPLLSDLDILDPRAVADAAIAHGVDLVVVGPEAPLAAGVVDDLEARGVAVFGPTRQAAQLEASKAYAKRVMRRANVPTGESWTFTTLEDALAHLFEASGPYVVKADGLAGGKGVLVTDDKTAAQGWARFCFDGRFGDAGSTVVIEEYLEGREVSVFALCDGKTAVPLEPARDYKRVGDDDTGPNTGGMGCFSPVDDLPDGLVDQTMATVIRPVLAQLSSEGVPYRGFLYAGLVLTADGPKVLEFNARLGDPETQVLLPRLEDDLAPLLAAGAAGRLDERALRWRDIAAVDVVLASAGYPDKPRTGVEISGLDEVAGHDGVHVFHAGTAMRDGEIVTSGGRVLNIVGTGADRAAARRTAYDAVSAISFDGMHHRTDIAAADDREVR